MRLYEISESYKDILSAFEDAESPEQIDELTEQLSTMQDTLESKAEAC